MRTKALGIDGVCILLLVALLCAAPIVASTAFAEKTTVVRVGYYENEVFQEGAREDAVKTGYAYEYYRKMSEYTGWEYPDVFDGHQDALDLYQSFEELLHGMFPNVNRRVQKTQITFVNRHVLACVSFARVKRKAIW